MATSVQHRNHFDSIQKNPIVNKIWEPSKLASPHIMKRRRIHLGHRLDPIQNLLKTIGESVSQSELLLLVPSTCLKDISRRFRPEDNASRIYSRSRLLTSCHGIPASGS